MYCTQVKVSLYFIDTQLEGVTCVLYVAAALPFRENESLYSERENHSNCMKDYMLGNPFSLGCYGVKHWVQFFAASAGVTASSYVVL